MTEPKHSTARELIDRVNDQNHKFRVSSIIFGIVTLVGLLLLVIICLNTLGRVNQQLAQQQQLLKSQQRILASIQLSSNQRTTQLNDLQNHIDCIVELLRQPNRQTLTISDLQDCQISSNGKVSSSSKWATGSAPSQPSAAISHQDTTSEGAKKPDHKTAGSSNAFYHIPILGRLFRALGL